MGHKRLTARAVTTGQIAKMIDHSLLAPELTGEDIRVGCELAALYQVMSVCARPSDVPLCVDLLRGTGVHVGTVAGFPHGSSATETKADETRLARAQGATEVDMVVNIGRLCSGGLCYVELDIHEVVVAAQGAVVKVILETGYLTDDQKVLGCQAAESGGAAYVDTGTGFGPSGATLDDLALMRAAVSRDVQVKAAGGVQDLDTLLAMASRGAGRFGATETCTILDDLAYRHRYGDRLTTANSAT